MVATEPTKPRRIELILRQIDSLPTLPVVATRLLSLTASDDSRAQEVIDLVSADPSLTAKVLSLCRSAERNVSESALTIERAVLLLGFNAIRNAVLSVKVFEMFGGEGSGFGVRRPGAGERVSGGEQADALNPEPRTLHPDDSHFDRLAFWSHSLAVAIIAEQIAKAHRGDRDLQADEAFVCGLLHDVGKLALDHVLPKAFSRIVEMADLNHGNIAEYERKVVGIDHHTAGKRLAEQWQLPHRLQDAIWLHGSAYDTLPRIEHQRLVGLVSLADMLARQQHVGYSGNHSIKQQPDVLIEKLGLNREAVHEAVAQLHDQMEVRGKALGLQDQPSRELFLQSMQHANAALGRLNQTLDRRTRTAAMQRQVLDAIAAFHGQTAPGQGVQDVLDAVVRSASRLFGEGFYAVLYPGDPLTGEDDSWLIAQYPAQGSPRWEYLDPPPQAPDISQLGGDEPVGMNLMGMLPWIADYLLEAGDLRQVKLLPLPSGWGTSAVLLHERSDLPAQQLLTAVTRTWGSAVASAAQHDGARRLGEQLAESNSQLAEAQDRLLQQESLARLGRMAGGAAHEMNNPLAVISGRSQLLAMGLQPGSKEQRTAQTIFEEAHRLSDLITTLHTFADPPAPTRKPADISATVDEAIKRVQSDSNAKKSASQQAPDISFRLRHDLPKLPIDADQVREAFMALLRNAMQAKPVTTIEVVGQLSPDEGSVVVQLRDDGPGMDQTTLNHAMDPFFSDRPAGRGMGMGLPRSKRIIEAHGGSLELHSTPGRGTVATVTLPMELA